MAIETEQTTTANEAPNSETSNPSANQEPASSSSTTEEANEETLDLGKAPEVETSDDAGKETDADQPDADKDGKGDEQDPETAKLFGAPADDAAYEISGLPEGTTVDQEALDAITPVARQLNLSNDGLSLIAATYAEKVLPRVAEQVVSNLQNDITTQRRDWEAEARQQIAGKDAEGKPIELKNATGDTLSFDGKKLGDVQSLAAKALDRLAPKGFREFLDDTGLGVHPMMIAFAYQAGKNIAEETSFEPSGGDTKPVRREDKYYS